MAQDPRIIKPTNNTHYVLATMVLMFMGVALTMGILYVRPLIDPLVVIAAVFGVLTPTGAAILALMKAQETHLSVNSRLDAFVASAQVEARREGQDQERERAAAHPVVPLAAVLPQVPVQQPQHVIGELPAKVVVVTGEEKK